MPHKRVFIEDQFEPWIELDMESLAWNLEGIRKHIKAEPITAVLKCNAYGHGMVEIAKALQELGVDRFAVAGHGDAARLREHNIEGTIIDLGVFTSFDTLPHILRIGNYLLGLGPFPPLTLKPVYSLKSRVLLTKKIPAGAEIGWNNEIKIKKDTLFAFVPVGYYDGYPPEALGKADVLIRGRRYPASGFISADHTTIDITGSTGIKIGDEVVLVGKQGNEEITNRELGKISGRGPYGLPARLNPSLPRLIKSPPGQIAVGVRFPVTKSTPGLPTDYFAPWIELDMQNLEWNVIETRKRVGRIPILAVVKCNAYGHGLVEISKALVKNGIRHFAVVKVWEALSLRKNNIRGMILNLGSFSPLEAADLVKHNISQSVFSGTVNILAKEARKQERRANVHIKIDTGLGRVGVPMEEAPDFFREVAAMPEINIEGVFTVLTGINKIPGQLKHFNRICDAAEKEGIPLGFRHAAASGDVSHGPADAYLDMVRPGNCLYGLSPASFANMDLKPVLSLKSRVLRIKETTAGTTVAHVTVGSCDGYPPNKSGKAEVLIKGRRYPLKGDISSHHITVDITGSADIETGDEVVLLGKQGDREITNAELSERSGQSVYRTPVYLNPHIPRLIK